MEIKNINQFRTVVECGSLAQAAGLLHTTAGALSKAIARLERDLGRELFNRHGRRLLLNDAGAAFYRDSEELVDAHQRLTASFDSSRLPPAPQIRMASFEVFTTHLMARVVEELPAALSFRVLELPVEDLADRVADRSVDLAITYAPFPRAGLDFTTIATTEFRIFGRRGRWQRTAFEELPFAVPTSDVRGSTAGLLGIDSWPYTEIPRLVKYQVTSLEAALALVRGGHCVVFIPTFIAQLVNATVRAPYRLTPIAAPRAMRRVRHRVQAIRRDDAESEPAVDALLDQLAKLIQSGETKEFSAARR